VSDGISEQTPKKIYDIYPIRTEIPPTQFKKLAFLGQDNTFTYEYAALFNDPGGSLGVTTF
jgi:hypothetical protein